MSAALPCPAAALGTGDAHAMLELANVPPPSRVDHAGLRHPVVAMADASAWDARLPGQRA